MKSAEKFEACLDRLEDVRRFVDNRLDGSRIEQGALFDLKLAIDEVFTNIVKYGLRNQESGKVSIEIEDKENQIQVVIEDSGEEFNPLDIAKPELNAPLEKREPGGMGIFLVKQLMDDVQYCRVEGRNVLTLRKTTLSSKDQKE